jgi:hypothetical protein
VFTTLGQELQKWQLLFFYGFNIVEENFCEMIMKTKKCILKPLLFHIDFRFYYHFEKLEFLHIQKLNQFIIFNGIQ